MPIRGKRLNFPLVPAHQNIECGTAYTGLGRQGRSSRLPRPLPGAFAACIVHGASVSTARAVTSVFKRFRRWGKADAFYHKFSASAEDADFEHAMIDVSLPAPPVRAGLRRIVKVHRHGQGAKRGLEVRPSDVLTAA